MEKKRRTESQTSNPKELQWYHVFKEAYIPHEQNKIAQLVQKRDYFGAMEKTLALPHPTPPTSIGGGRLYAGDEERGKYSEQLKLRGRVIEQGVRYILERMRQDQEDDGK